MTAAETLRDHRLRSGLTQAEVAALTGIQRPRISEWERGVKKPSYETVERILRALGYTVATIEAGEQR